MRRQLGELSCKVETDIRPVYKSKDRTRDQTKKKEASYYYPSTFCLLVWLVRCKPKYVGYTCQHLYQPVEGRNESSSIRNHSQLVSSYHGSLIFLASILIFTV